MVFIYRDREDNWYLSWNVKKGNKDMERSKQFKQLYEQLIQEFEERLNRPLTTAENQFLKQIAQKQTE